MIIDNKTQTRYIQTIDAIDATSDRITISERDPNNPGAPGMPMVGMSYAFVAAKPHSYITGQAFTYTQTVETVS